MNTEKKQLAKDLFFQTKLTKTQIATMLGVSRRSLTYWSREGDWSRLRESSIHLPSLLAEKCYHIMGHLTDDYLSERRITNPVSPKEIDGLYKLTLTINKLKNRSTLNESMEMFGFFLDGLKKNDEDLAVKITPHIEKYVESRASIYATNLMPGTFSGIGGRLPWEPEDTSEKQLDNREAFFDDPDTIQTYAETGIPYPTDEEIATLPPRTEQQPETDKEAFTRCTRERQETLQKFVQYQNEKSKAAQNNAQPATDSKSRIDTGSQTLNNTIEAGNDADVALTEQVDSILAGWEKHLQQSKTEDQPLPQSPLPLRPIQKTILRGSHKKRKKCAKI